MTTFFYSTTGNSQSKVKRFLEQNNIPYKKRSLGHAEPLEWEEFIEILSCSNDGVDEVLSTRSKAYTKLTQSGIDFDELSMKELYRLFRDNPGLLKSPMVVTKGMLVIGYNEDEITMLIPRKQRRETLWKLMSQSQHDDIIECDEQLLAI